MLERETNLHAATVEGFGQEWAKFDHQSAPQIETENLFKNYFKLFPFAKLNRETSVGADFGCGSGRWAKYIAPSVKHLHLLDASAKALSVARQNLSATQNVSFHEASIEDLPLAAASLDFAYSLGVLHHLPDTAKALKDIANFLKPGSPFLVYLYYSLDERPFHFRLAWKISTIFRRLIAPLPFALRLSVCNLIALTVYWPLARSAKFLEKLNLLPNHFPLSFYRNLPFYFLRNDALDRFGTALEQRFSRDEIERMLLDAGFTHVRFMEGEPYWCCLSEKAGSL